MAKELKNIFKYIDRSNGNPVYFSRHGNDYFERSKNFRKFKFEGMISQKEREQEEEERLKNHEALNEEEEEEQAEFSTSKTKAKVRELTTEELDKITKPKKTVVRKSKKEEEEEEDRELKEGTSDLDSKNDLED